MNDVAENSSAAAAESNDAVNDVAMIRRRITMGHRDHHNGVGWYAILEW